jgi:acetylornithine deacetylase/succinyl-diaminopimelate desuccinylase-like protein
MRRRQRLFPAPTFQEAERAKAFKSLLEQSGLADVRIDSAGNVIGLRKGRGTGLPIVLDAHLDTVFPIETDVKVRIEEGKYFAPGITDDTRGLAAMLSVLRALEAAEIQTDRDIIFLGSVGEEGLGDLKGVKQFFRDHPKVGAYIGFESIPQGSLVNANAGSNRFEITYTAPGGHSFGAFGDVPSAIHALGRAVAMISDLQVPETPRTTFNVGMISGGRSVNTIADKAVMEIDIRSDGAAELKNATEQVLAFAEKAAQDENARWGQDTLNLSVRKIGERPTGTTPADSVIVQAGLAAMNAMGQQRLILGSVSTNAAIPMSMGIPAVQMAPGGVFWGFHALSEGMDPKDAYRGPQVALLQLLAMAGLSGVTEPLAGTTAP